LKNPPFQIKIIGKLPFGVLIIEVTTFLECAEQIQRRGNLLQAGHQGALMLFWPIPALCGDRPKNLLGQNPQAPYLTQISSAAAHRTGAFLFVVDFCSDLRQAASLW